MKKFVCMIALTVTVAGCAGGVSTGRKSPCAGKSSADGSYAVASQTAASGGVVSRNSYSPNRMSFATGASDDCQFTAF